MKTGLPGFIEELFSILGKYSKHGAAIGPNQELVATAFRAMTDIISISHEAPISEAQLQVDINAYISFLFVFSFRHFLLGLQLLLTFIEEDIHDPQRQSTAFPLLKVCHCSFPLLRMIWLSCSNHCSYVLFVSMW